MRNLVDHVLCSLPFEEPWLRQYGCNATFIGHPFFDEVRRQTLDDAFVAQMRSRPGPLVTILPGSRTQEVSHNLKWFLKTAGHVREAVPGVRFAVAAFKPQQAELAAEEVAQSGLPVEVYSEKTPELIHLADCCMACSGSVSLELLYQTKPTVILYWITPFAFRVQKIFRQVKYITLVNLLAADELFPKDLTPYDPGQADAHRVLFPEYLTCEDKSAQIATHLTTWLTDHAAREGLVARLAELKTLIAHGGASARAADYILRTLCYNGSASSHPTRPAKESLLC
jgi:lipid-A-disaccharide synthase